MTRGRGASFGQSVLVVCIVTLLCMAALELAYRAASGIPVLWLVDWRAERLVKAASGESEYDPVVGWVNKASITRPGFNTIAHGVRKNGAEMAIRQGGALVVGDSFAAGAKVSDAESWPAQLENRLGQPVINAAVGAWGIDQMVLRIEQLRAVAEPKIVILGTQEDGIMRVGFSRFAGSSRPYFTQSNGRLVVHNQPVPRGQHADDRPSMMRDVLSYSYVAAQLMGTIDPDYWFTLSGPQYKRAPVNEVEVSCALLARLKSRNDALNVRTVLVLQYSYYSLLATRQVHTDEVAECAREAGLDVVDTYEPLRQLGAQALEAMFVREGGRLGHMSSRGNAFVADLVYERLQKTPATAFRPQTAVPPTDRPGDGVNRIVASEELVGRASVASAHFGFSSSVVPSGAANVYKLEASAPDGEHYIEVPVTKASSGEYVLSLLVKPAPATRLRLQLLDQHLNGVLLDCDFVEQIADARRLSGVRKVRHSIQAMSNGWYRVTVSAILPGAKPRVLLQLLDRAGRSAFAPAGEAVDFALLQLESGQIASFYRPTLAAVR